MIRDIPTARATDAASEQAVEDTADRRKPRR
jgi:hypothetical protein